MPDNLSHKTAAFIKEKRLASGLSQSDLAVLAFGNSQMKSYVCAIETQKKDITIPTLKNLLKALKTDLIFISLSGSYRSDDISEFIRTQRLNLGLGQGKLSMLVYGDKASKGNISKIEAGKKQISTITLGYILKALDSDISFIE